MNLSHADIANIFYVRELFCIAQRHGGSVDCVEIEPEKEDDEQVLVVPRLCYGFFTTPSSL